MRILHSSDWHLGHQLHQTQREYEFNAFIDWMQATLEEQAPDAFLLAGDIFDTANPPIWAIRLWHRFLGQVRRQLPQMEVVVIGGNHDSPSRLESTNPILHELDIHIVGGVPWQHQDGKRELDIDKLLIPLTDEKGLTQAWVIAMPFIRMSDLNPASDQDGDPLVTAFAELYRQAFEAASAKKEGDQRLIAMGHAYMRGGQLSAWSERKVLGGNQHAIPVSVFSDEVDYVALGHLHLAQAVGGRENVRYSGAPLPLSFNEAKYPHQVRLIEWQADQALTSQSIRVPKAVDFLRIPDKEAAAWDQVQAELEALPQRADQPAEVLPFLEVRVALEQPQPDLRRRIVEILDDKAARLLKVSVSYPKQKRQAASFVSLQDVDPEQLFRRRYAQEFEGEPGETLMQHFHKVREAAEAQS